MIEQIEIASLNLRYGSCRLKSPGAERVLLSSIAHKGITDALQGVDTNKGKEQRILLDGFKRYRCAKRLGISIVPYCSLGSDEACGIMQLLRISIANSLSILEQAVLIDELMSQHMMGNAQIAMSLERSKAWVSVRTGIIREMSECVRKQIFSGRFPVYSYMYTLRQFIRINRVAKKDVDEFVQAVAGKHLSIREIDLLAHGYFKGSVELRRQINTGELSWALSRLKQPAADTDGCSEFERTMLSDLEITQKYMQRLINKSTDQRLKTNAFYSQANILSGGIVRHIEKFSQSLREFYDRSGKA
ncbi:MAG: chromosome partitioning protein ParB [Planctomycetes bacterium]|nr:chromosome partitioning protein ParB [Planctomycetota bacterium]